MVNLIKNKRLMESDFSDFSDEEKAIFCLFCIKQLPSVPDYLQSKKEDLILFLSMRARKIINEVNPDFLNQIKTNIEIARAEKIENCKPNPNYNLNHANAANTEHLLYDSYLNSAISFLEASRLNAYYTYNNVSASIKNDMIARCHGDPRDLLIKEVSEQVKDFNNNCFKVFFVLKNHHYNNLDNIEKLLKTFVLHKFSKQDYEYFSGDRRNALYNNDLRKTKDIYTASTETIFDYQVFISFKNLTINGKPTEDSELAKSLFEHLKSLNLNVFFSNITLEKMGFSAYQDAIDSALDSSQILIVVCTDKKNVLSRQVKYEWQSFYNDILSNIKPNGRIFTFIRRLPISELPRRLRQNQVFYDDRNEKDKLTNFILNSLI